MRLVSLTFLMLLAALPAGAAEDWVPPGFETLNEPQTTAVDVYYGGYFLTSTLARFDHDELSFIDPQALILRLTDLKDPDEAAALMSRPLALNADQLCHSEFQLDCGTLQPEDVNIIFDRGNLRAWLFIAQDLLRTRQAKENKYLPRSSAALSLFSDSALFFNQAGEQDTHYNVANNTQIALAENRLQIRSNLTDEEGLIVDTLALSREFQGRRLAAGLFRGDVNNARFMSSEQFVGASFRTSLETRTDLSQFQGNTIELFLETRSRVEIYQDGRLYSTEYYDVGNQELETSTLPPGSYEIEIRITDAAGNTRSERRFFSKNSHLPPVDQDLFFVQAGRLVDERHRNSNLEADATFLRAGYSKRLTATLGADVGLSLTRDSTMVETGLFQQGRNYQFQAGLAFESTGAAGLTSNLRVTAERFTMNFSARRVLSGEREKQLGTAINQLSSSVEMPTRFGPLSLFYRRNARGDDFEGQNIGLRWRSNFYDLGSGNLNASFEVSHNDEDLFAALTLNYRFGGAGVTHSIAPRLVHESGPNAAGRNAFRGTMESRLAMAPGRYLSLRADRNTRSALEARMELEGRRGSADVAARYNLETSDQEFFGRLSGRFAATGSSAAFGGARSGESALLVAVEGVSPERRFEVLVNGSPRGEVNAGGTLLLPVAPYETYDISLKPLGDAIVDLDSRSYRRTVYPGNVIDVSWEAREVVIAYGRLFDAVGEPISDALLTNVIGLATTDAGGFFQAEIDRNTRTLEVKKGAKTCRVRLQGEPDARQLMPLGDLTCDNIFGDERDTLFVGG
ncbi:MAG: TcfC E-set like domain-containing protein [Pseudohongiellaceae bacterium]